MPVAGYVITMVNNSIEIARYSTMLYYVACSAAGFSLASPLRTLGCSRPGVLSFWDWLIHFTLFQYTGLILFWN